MVVVGGGFELLKAQRAKRFAREVTTVKYQNILITGALGHIGSALIRDPLLLGCTTKLTLVDDLSTQRYCSLFGLPLGVKYSYLKGDVASVVSDEMLAHTDAVVHLAGTVDPTRSYGDLQNLRNNNLRITKHLAECCLRSKTPLIFASSTSVYTPSCLSVDESSTELKPAGGYAQCKLEEESLIRKTMTSERFIIFRFGTIFGPSPGMQFQTAVNKFCWEALRGVPIEVWRTALVQTRPYLAVSDCTRLLSHAIINEIYPNQIVNAATCNVTAQTVLDCIRSQGLSTTVNVVESPAMNQLSFSASTSLAKSLGFSFSSTLEGGIAETLQLLGGITKFK